MLWTFERIVYQIKKKKNKSKYEDTLLKNYIW